MAKKPRTPKPPSPAQASERRVQAPQRRAGPSRTAKPSGLVANSRYWILGGVGALLVIGGIVGIVVATSGTTKFKPALTKSISWGDLPGLQTAKPPWSNDGTTLSARVGTLGLQSLSQEALAFHIHQHLDVYVDGAHVTLPQFLGFGIDPATNKARFITEMHTHDSSGLIHVESAQHLNYVLGQLFGEWGVRLTSKCIGSYKGSCNNLQWWVNGKKRVGNPARLILKPHQEIVISTEKPPASIPNKYAFPSGT